ncbi:hypothetical protein [Ramlibacter sp. AN1133]|uniref:hypothetical protein n=1 Tax=Ramlibacter sp. AN1133 TaxID=3133429 RepID=UPI0030BF819B
MKRRLAAILLAVGALPAFAQPQAPSPPPSEAERLVFQQDHLANTRQPRTLRYAYVEEAEGKPRVTDRALITLSNGAAGRCCDVHGDYLSGAQAVNLPDIPEARGNPVVLYFLEGEVRRLQRTTTGQAAHFRRRIRQSFADAATVSETTITWAGKTAPARLVRIAPFLDDPFRARFQDQAATEYAIVLSDAVPGGVYQLRAMLPGDAAGAAPRASRTLTIDASN